MRWRDLTIAVPMHPYLPTSFPLAKGQEEPCNGSPAHGGTFREGVAATATFGAIPTPVRGVSVFGRGRPRSALEVPG